MRYRFWRSDGQRGRNLVSLSWLGSTNANSLSSSLWAWVIVAVLPLFRFLSKLSAFLGLRLNSPFSSFVLLWQQWFIPFLAPCAIEMNSPCVPSCWWCQRPVLLLKNLLSFFDLVLLPCMLHCELEPKCSDGLLPFRQHQYHQGFVLDSLADNLLHHAEWWVCKH